MAEKILIVGPAWVGDMVMAQSLFITLKKRNPSCLIDVLAPEWSRPLLERMPEVNQAIALPIDHGNLKLNIRYQIAQQLKSKKYDQAIVLANSWKSALIPWWAKIPKRTGWRGEMRYVLLNDIRLLNKQAIPRMVERFTALAVDREGLYTNPILKQKETASPKLKTDPKQIQIALEKFSIRLTKAPILALCPGAEFGPSKRWPEEHYATLAQQKIKEGWQVFLFGSKKDMPVCDYIQQATQHQCIDLTGKTSLGEAIDLLSIANAVVSNDSGLMHIAAALDKPLIAVYGSTDPGFTPPLHSKANILRLSLPCSPCFKRECPLTHHRCMKDLSPERVMSALDSLSASNPSANPLAATLANTVEESLER